MLGSAKLFFLLAMVVMVTADADNLYNKQSNPVVFYWNSFRPLKGVGKTLIDYSQLQITEFLLNDGKTFYYLIGEIHLNEELTDAVQIRYSLGNVAAIHFDDWDERTFSACEFIGGLFYDAFRPLYENHTSITGTKPLACPAKPGTAFFNQINDPSELRAPSILKTGRFDVSVEYVCDGKTCGGFEGEVVPQLV